MYDDIVKWLQEKGLQVDALAKGKPGQECFLKNTAKQDPRWMPKYHLYEGYCSRSRDGNIKGCELCSDPKIDYLDISIRCDGKMLQVAIPWERSRWANPVGDSLRKKAGIYFPNSDYLMLVLPDFIREFHKLWDEGKIPELMIDE